MWYTLYMHRIEYWVELNWIELNSICYSAIKKNEILPFVIAWIDLDSPIHSQHGFTKHFIMLSEIGQTEKDKYYM